MPRHGGGLHRQKARRSLRRRRREEADGLHKKSSQRRQRQRPVRAEVDAFAIDAARSSRSRDRRGATGVVPPFGETGSAFLTRPGFLPLSDADSEDFSTRGVPHAATPQAGGHD